MSTLIRQMTVLNSIANVSRYSRDYMIKRESLLEHIGFCTIYANLMYYELLRLNKSFSKVLNIGTILKKVSIHDIDEVGTADVVRNVKHHNKEMLDQFDKLEKDSVTYTDEYLGCMNQLFEDWNNAKDKSLEGAFVRIIDLVSVYYKVWEELYMLNNKQFIRVASEYLSTMKTISFKKYLDDALQSYIDTVLKSDLTGNDADELSYILSRYVNDLQTTIVSTLEMMISGQLVIKDLTDPIKFLSVSTEN